MSQLSKLLQQLPTMLESGVRDLPQRLADNPMGYGAGLGALGGSALGGGSTALANLFREKKDRESIFNNTLLGGVAGGVVGGLLGNQVGQGRGRTVATVAGVLGGALAGNKIEKTMKKKQTYETVVRYEDGTTQVFPSETSPGWREGDKVRLDNGTLISR